MERYDPVKQEKETLRFWEQKKLHQKAKDKNKGKKKFYFLDGPPYTSGKVHLGTAWNKSLKDMVLRYKRMIGLDVWDRAGYDMHGMPTEHGAEKILGIKNKDEIPKIGVAKFIKTCRKFAEDNLKVMNKDFMKLGVWMDFENAYKSVENTYIEGEWWLIKKAHENKRLYEGQKTMHWCPRCGTALAKHELEYKKVQDNSIFVKFPIRNEKNEFLIVWTTTPWTIPFNLGVMVNPDLDYVKVKADNEIYIVAKELINSTEEVSGKKLKIMNEFKGKKIEGIKYDHPFDDEISIYKDLEKKHPKVQTIVLSDEYVNLEQGSGLVHMAPGCGPEDYEIGHRNNIPPFNNLSESGIFPENFGKFGGLKAKKDDDKIIDALENKNALIGNTSVDHDYAHCWRCKEPIIYRTTTQWFFKIEDLKEKMRKLNKEINWIPDYAGSKNFDNWLENLRDNGITRQRYWGAPLPVWRCDSCKEYIVIGSIKELESLAGKLPEDLHKPWIDHVKIKCECGSQKERIPDILDVWIDAGSASWNCLDYPRKKELFEKLYPADFILEGIDQIRGWFNLLFVASMVAMNNCSYKAVYMHGFINDSQGRKMSKSLGNYILPDEVIDKFGADTFRYYSISGADPGLDLNYNFDDMKVKHKNLTVLWNLHNYVIDLSKNLKVNPKDLKINKKDFSIEEKYIFSKLNSTLKKVTELFEKYKLNEIPWLIEDLYLELSRTYIQLTREKSSIGSDKEKKIVLYTIYNTLILIVKMFAPVVPFVTERIFQNLKKEFSFEEKSIHLHSWPSFDANLIDEDLELQMDYMSSIIQSSLSLREKVQLGIRWPLKEIIVVTEDKKVIEAVKKLKELIKIQVNVKDIKIQKELSGVKLNVKPDYSRLGPDFGDKAPKIIGKLSADSPETILNHIQKEGKYTFNIDNEQINIVKEHLIVQRKVPDPYVESSFKGNFVYLNRELDDELEAEGFSREITRRVQSLRKKSGLLKSDKITLFVRTDSELKEMLDKFEKLIKAKVNASTLKISELKPVKKLNNHSKEKVRDKKFELFLGKV